MRFEDKEKSGDALWFGLFPVDDETLDFLRDAGTLDKPVDYPHITFGYKVAPPADIDWESTYDIEVVGYGNDGENEGYAVSLPDELADMYFGADIPHVTLSTSIEGSPVNTAFIEFDEIEPFVLPMKFGFYLRGRYYL